jgi:phage repressor protein C with HTH and peptisase S24 domain
MSLADRIREARKKKGLVQKDVAAHFQISTAAVGQWETGVTVPEGARLPELAKLLEVSLDWLAGAGPALSNSSELPSPQEMPRDVPVLGIASCGPDGNFVFEGGGPIDFVRRPPRIRGLVNVYALYVQGESMSPWREEGELVYVHERQPVQVGDFVVVQVRDEEHPNSAYIKKLLRRNEREVRLLQYNPRKEISIPAKRIVAIHRILNWSELLGV